jgi:C-terminal processing protease CtpA/Prc
LQDIGRAVVVGERTVGKGSVQSVYRFGDGAGFKLTTAMYSLPSGRTIHGAGITPDVVVEEEEAGDGSEGDAEAGGDRHDGEETDAILAKGIEEIDQLLRADGRSVNGASSGD